MRIIREHALERFWLERRLELLDVLDNISERVFWENEESDVSKEDSPQIRLLENHYRDVLNPGDLLAALKTIYKEDMYWKKV